MLALKETDSPTFKVLEIECGSGTPVYRKIQIWFSYTEPVAFLDSFSGQLLVSENVWRTTTGKHLNSIQSDKRKRLPRGQFLRELSLLEKSLIKNIGGERGKDNNQQV